MKAIITGAARGIGRAIAVELARKAAPSGGARLLLCDLREDDLASTQAAVEALGAKAWVCAGDLSDPLEPARIAQQAEVLQGLDCVVSNAGIALRGPLLHYAVEDWDRSFAVHVRAPWLLGKACHAALRQSRGSLIITASISGEHATVPGGAYSSSKAAALMLARQLAVEWGPDGIRVNSVSPGMIVTPMTQEVYEDPSSRAQREARVPLHRIGQPEDIAQAVAFLASPEASYINGADLVVDGALVHTLMAHNPGWKPGSVR